MKKIIILFLSFLVGIGLNAQQGAGYMTQKPVLKISAMKDGQNVQWENPDISVALDYKIGTFTVKLNNDDFRINQTNQLAVSDTVEDSREFTLSGIFPIDQITDQLAVNKKYIVELQLSNWDLSINHTLNFNLNVTNPGTSKVNYRMFQMDGILYNDELQLPALTGFDNEVHIWISFIGYSNTN